MSGPDRDTTHASATSAGRARDRSHAGLALAVGSAGFFLITLDILIVNVALTRIGRELGGGTSGQQWVIDGYTLLFASLLLFAGNLADRIGAKRALGMGIVLFAVTSTACAVAPSLGALIAARVVQGASAAVMLPASMSLIREAFPDPARRARALGVWAVGGAVAGAVGPLLGGLLTTLSWRLVFGINLPVCVIMLALLARVATSPRHPARFDWTGQVLAVLALGSLIAGLVEGGSVGFDDPVVLGALATAAVATVAFVAVQARVRQPMMPLGLFTHAGVRLALLVGFSFMVGNFGTVFLLALYLQQHLGLTPLAAGLYLFPSAIFSIIGNLISGPVTNRFGTRVPVGVGLALMTLGVLGMAAVAPLGSPLPVTAFMVLTGGGGALAMPPVSGLVLASVPLQQAGTASAVFNTFRQVGGAVAIAVFGALVAAPHAFVPGLQLSFVITAVLLGASALLGFTSRATRPTAAA